MKNINKSYMISKSTKNPDARPRLRGTQLAVSRSRTQLPTPRTTWYKHEFGTSDFALSSKADPGWKQQE